MINGVLHSRRGVSPVIATVLLVALVIVGSTVITAVINNANQNSENYANDANDQTIGTVSDTTALVDPSISITKLTRDTSLQLQGINDFVKIEVNVTNNDPRSLYVIDIDILVYGVKLDEIVQWKIINAFGASAVTKNGEEAGYLQTAYSSARYQVEVQDKYNALGRIPDNTNFKIEVFYGDEPGLVTNSIQKEKISEIIFSPVYYNIAIFHHGTTWASDDAATQYENTINKINGTTSLFLLYQRSQDSYNYNDAPTMNAIRSNIANFSKSYDIVIVDVWAVPNVAADILTFLHNNGTELIFYGSVNDLGGSLSAIRSAVNATATEELAGLVPDPYDPAVYPDPGGGGLFSESTDNGYDFVTSTDAVMGGLSGVHYAEQELSFWTVGDDYGVDSANLTSINPSNYTVYGYAYYNFMRSGNSYWTHYGPLLTYNPGTNSSGHVYSFVWKHNDDLGGIRATVNNPTQLSDVRKNMLTATIGEVERTAAEVATVKIESVSILGVSNNNRRFKVDIIANVTSGVVINDSLSFILDMPDALNFNIWSEIFAPNGQILVNGNSITTSMPVIITSGNVVQIDFSTYYNGPLAAGDIIEIYLPAGNRDFALSSSDTTLYNWTVSASYNLIQQTVTQFELKVINPSYPLVLMQTNTILSDAGKLLMINRID